jgi:NAD-dependent dihydropyrimidine dehydrogenase PreA subunit
MARWFENAPKLTSLQLKPPGLIELLLKRSFIVSASDFVFHFGMIGLFLTALVMELANLVQGFSSLFAGYGWVITRLHGITGAILLVGGVVYVYRYFSNRFFRIAYGRIFYVDLAFLGAIGVLGITQSLQTWGFTPATEGLQLKIILVYSWLLVSLVGGGAVRHLLGTIGWRVFSITGAMPAIYYSFSDGCGKCGKCIEVCPLYEAHGERDEDAPALKLRKYLKMLATQKLSLTQVKRVAEDVYVCTLCGLCVGVCPYSFPYVSFYKDLLKYVNSLYKKVEIPTAIRSAVKVTT